MKKNNSRHSLGLEGEDLACELLLKKGYTILNRNFRFRKAEIDIVAFRDEWVVFVEVKSRTTKWIENLAELVTPKQRKLLVQAADHYMVSNGMRHEARFDIITVYRSPTSLEIVHMVNAFYHF